MVFLFCCVFGVLCIFVIYTRGTRRELQLVREQMKTIELNDTNIDTMDDASPISTDNTKPIKAEKKKKRDTLNLVIAESEDIQQNVVKYNDDVRFQSKSMAIPMAGAHNNYGNMVNHRVHQNVHGMNHHSLDEMNNMSNAEGMSMNNNNNNMLRVNSVSAAYEVDMINEYGQEYDFQMNTNGNDGEHDEQEKEEISSSKSEESDNVDIMNMQNTLETPMTPKSEIEPHSNVLGDDND